MSLDRKLERYQRAQAGEPYSKVLDKFNDRPDMKERYLHATKGYRTFSVKRSKAAMITAEQKAGKFPPSIISWQQIKKILKQDIAG